MVTADEQEIQRRFEMLRNNFRDYVIKRLFTPETISYTFLSKYLANHEDVELYLSDLVDTIEINKNVLDKCTNAFKRKEVIEQALDDLGYVKMKDHYKLSEDNTIDNYFS